MINEANVPMLLGCILNNENAQDFNLTRWVSDCGTYGCLVGNDMIAKGRVACSLKKGNYHDYKNAEPEIIDLYGSSGTCPFKLATQEYGISLRVSRWLFLMVEEVRREYHYTDNDGHVILKSVGRDCNDREAAINRIRKLVYYILHKREMLYDENGVRETARRAEGNQMVMQQVLKKVESKEAVCC